MKRIHKHMAHLGVSLLFSMLAASAFADAPDYVRVRSITSAGSGCPAGSVVQNISQDRQAFTLLFDSAVGRVAVSTRRVATHRDVVECRVPLLVDTTTPQTCVIVVDLRRRA